jgi:hypothetical protein
MEESCSGSETLVFAHYRFLRHPRWDDRISPFFSTAHIWSSRYPPQCIVHHVSSPSSTLHSFSITARLFKALLSMGSSVPESSLGQAASVICVIC